MDPDDDLCFILQSKSTQTDFKADLEELLDIKNAYNELVLSHRILEEKYEKAKSKFAEVKDALEETQIRSIQMPRIYEQAYRDVERRYRRVDRDYRNLKDKITDIRAILDS